MKYFILLVLAAVLAACYAAPGAQETNPEETDDLETAQQFYGYGYGYRRPYYGGGYGYRRRFGYGGYGGYGGGYGYGGYGWGK